jgi:hypothetical protein
VSRHGCSFPAVTVTSRLQTTWPSAGRVRRAPRAPAEDFRTPVRGHGFAARPRGEPAPSAGAPAELVREPDNPADPLAVAVWTVGQRPWRLGYLDRTVAARLASRLDAGQRYRVELAGWVQAPGGWHRPLARVVTDGPTGAVADVAADRAGLWGRPPASTRRVISSAR